MAPSANRHCAGLLVLLLVVTSMPVRVLLLGACPVCGGWHLPILVAHVGAQPDEPTKNETPDDDPPASHHDDDRYVTGCHPPLPYGPTHTEAVRISHFSFGHLHPESDSFAETNHTFSLIRPPRA